MVGHGRDEPRSTTREQRDFPKEPPTLASAGYQSMDRVFLHTGLGRLLYPVAQINYGTTTRDDISEDDMELIMGLRIDKLRN